MKIKRKWKCECGRTEEYCRGDVFRFYPKGLKCLCGKIMKVSD